MKRIALLFVFITYSLSAVADSDILDDYIPDNLSSIPKDVYVTAPVSAEEGAVGTSDQFGLKFDKSIFKKYPDLKKIKFEPDESMKQDRESLNIYKNGFYRALYFSKLINIINGETLFDFITKCGVLNKTASIADRGEADSNQFTIQYFVNLRRADNNEIVGESIYFNRVGNKFIADRTPFAYFMISDENFMKTFGLKCNK
ncbi:hypothetical protein [Martelella alba]|uniref:Uncharacterized protein n=1 Tax=Martelella alba TaxID=2590451 RepID=A0ABY2SFA7_9HYPH|nr:hypothetical protein [Martelella alba]TKI03584.1 hypothetical protein FCN80_21135 [Martelella alba]